MTATAIFCSLGALYCALRAVRILRASHVLMHKGSEAFRVRYSFRVFGLPKDWDAQRFVNTWAASEAGSRRLCVHLVCVVVFGIAAGVLWWITLR